MSETPRADKVYCDMMNNGKRDECLGEDYKIANGLFTKANLEAHRKSSVLYGKHLAYHETEIEITTLNQTIRELEEALLIEVNRVIELREGLIKIRDVDDTIYKCESTARDLLAKTEQPEREKEDG